MKYADHPWYVVFLCGPTDCFPHAAFLDEDEAKKWGIAYNKHADYLVKKMTLAELADITDD